MNALIAIGTTTLHGEAVPTVNARDLHAFLEVGKDFSTWIKDRVEQYDFLEKRDFVTAENLCSPESGNAKARQQIRKDYHLSLDMAKELAMVERNEKGKQARMYFIECERQAKTPTASLSRMDILKLALESEQRALALEEEKKVLEATVEEQAPKVAALERLAKSEGSLCITNAAKDLQLRPKDLFAWLQANHWIYRRVGGAGWVGPTKKFCSVAC
jgi:phage anti-repressor protein